MYYQRHGEIPKKQFTVLRAPSGMPLHEELMTSRGFGGPSSLLYRLRPSTATLGVAPLDSQPLQRWDPGVVRNHQLDLPRVESKGTYLASRVPLFFNEDFVYSICRPSEADDFYRNGLCDELLMVISGRGVLRSAFGDLAYGPLDLVYVPRGTTIQFTEISGEQTMAVMETSGPLGPPPHHIGRSGQLQDRSLYKERDLRTPQFRGAVDEVGEFDVAVKFGDDCTSYLVGSHPFDAIGWDGYLYPFAVSLRDLTPLAGRVHPVPDLYQVFGSDGIAISAITPVRNPDHPDTTPTQPDHNADCDEVFHRLGTPRDPSPDGKVTLHTRAATHGAKPPFKEQEPRERNTGFGIIIDVSRRVLLAAGAEPVDEPSYHRSWIA
jgi:homogentisate 1,2-dioxygenase